MRQSDSRVPGSGGEPAAPRRDLPMSFGRPRPEEPVEVPVGAASAPVRVQDGQVVLSVGADLVLGKEAQQAFYDQVRELTLLAVQDGLAQAMAGVVAQGVAPAGDAAGTS